MKVEINEDIEATIKQNKEIKNWLSKHKKGLRKFYLVVLFFTLFGKEIGGIAAGLANLAIIIWFFTFFIVLILSGMVDGKRVSEKSSYINLDLKDNELSNSFGKTDKKTVLAELTKEGEIFLKKDFVSNKKDGKKIKNKIEKIKHKIGEKKERKEGNLDIDSILKQTEEERKNRVIFNQDMYANSNGKFFGFFNYIKNSKEEWKMKFYMFIFFIIILFVYLNLEILKDLKDIFEW